MINRYRKLLLVVCGALILVCISVSATVAYLTDNEAATNTFAVGKVALKLDEADVDELGRKISNDRVQENEYKLVPGHTYIKDPTVTVVADSDASYIRMLVTVTDYSDLLAVCRAHSGEVDKNGNPYLVGDVVLLQNFTDWEADSKWQYFGFVRDAAGDTATYEFRYSETVSTSGAAAKKLEPLFGVITVPGWMNNTDIMVLSESYVCNEAPSTNAYAPEADEDDAPFRIDVVAHAMQAAGFDTAEDAWAAFDEK